MRRPSVETKKTSAHGAKLRKDSRRTISSDGRREFFLTKYKNICEVSTERHPRFSFSQFLSFLLGFSNENTYLCTRQINLETRYMERMNDKGKEKLSLWERAKRMGKVMELAPGFSFDSDSKVKTYV